MPVRVRDVMLEAFAPAPERPKRLCRPLPASDVEASNWELYERDKRALRRDLGPREYEIAVAELARELGL